MIEGRVLRQFSEFAQNTSGALGRISLFLPPRWAPVGGPGVEWSLVPVPTVSRTC